MGNVLKRALKATLPVLGGYLFLGIGFGILLYQKGYGLFYSFLMAVFIYAGSLQYAGAGFLLPGTSLLNAGWTSFLLNVRHLFYGLSMIGRYRDTGKKKPYLIFSLTDETYSVLSSPEYREEGEDFLFFVSLFDHLYWITGCCTGSLLAESFSLSIKGFDFVLTALFLTIFVDQLFKEKDRFSSWTGLFVSLFCLILFGKEVFLIPSMVLIAVILTLKRRRES
ncbi:MAG: AzlC family ABC transporter permease [Erysipelotrichaceae bacterium]|nr:AzlC family ABC transporter permease [Erysipelotrichaceae bacterium]